MLTKKREGVGLEEFHNCKVFNKYANDMDDIYERIEEWNSDKEHKILIALNDMITDMLRNKKT